MIHFIAAHKSSITETVCYIDWKGKIAELAREAVPDLNLLPPTNNFPPNVFTALIFFSGPQCLINRKIGGICPASFNFLEMNVLGWTALLYCGNMKGPEINSIYSAVSPNWISSSLSHSQKLNILHKRIIFKSKLVFNLLLLNNVKTNDSLAFCPFISPEMDFDGRAGNMSCFVSKMFSSVWNFVWLILHLPLTIYCIYHI